MLRRLLIFTFIVCALPAGAADRVAMRVSPTVAFAPATLRVVATIEPHPDARAVEVVAESVEYYRSSMVPLAGGRAPRQSHFQFRDVPGGFYDVTTTLIDAGGHRTTVHQQVRIVDRRP